jgi:hypothetical protein
MYESAHFISLKTLSGSTATLSDSTDAIASRRSTTSAPSPATAARTTSPRVGAGSAPQPAAAGTSALRVRSTCLHLVAANVPWDRASPTTRVPSKAIHSRTTAPPTSSAAPAPHRRRGILRSLDAAIAADTPPQRAPRLWFVPHRRKAQRLRPVAPTFPPRRQAMLPYSPSIPRRDGPSTPPDTACSKPAREHPGPPPWYGDVVARPTSRSAGDIRLRRRPDLIIWAAGYRSRSFLGSNVFTWRHRPDLFLRSSTRRDGLSVMGLFEVDGAPVLSLGAAFSRAIEAQSAPTPPARCGSGDDPTLRRHATSTPRRHLDSGLRLPAAHHRLGAQAAHGCPLRRARRRVGI